MVVALCGVIREDFIKKALCSFEYCPNKVDPQKVKTKKKNILIKLVMVLVSVMVMVVVMET